MNTVRMHLLQALLGIAVVGLAACHGGGNDGVVGGGGGTTPTACADGADNDADGKVDLADPGCSSALDTNESDPLTGDSFDAYADYGLFLNVLSPGQADCPAGDATPSPADDCSENFTDQLKMYENLAFTNPGDLKTVADLVPAFYKTGAFVAPTGVPPADAQDPDTETKFTTVLDVSDADHAARIKRDTFGVPQIYGDSRANVMFGTGYATAENRMFAMDTLRHIGRGRESDFIGTPIGLASYDADLGIKAGYTEAELQAQGEQLEPRFGADGAQALDDVSHYVAGINAYIATIAGTPSQPFEYTALGLTLRPFTSRDVVAIATLVQAIFAVGGGAEHRQAMLLREIEALTLQAGGTKAEACALWRDLRHLDDPEKQTSADDRFETQSPPTIDEDACPLSASFASTYPGAVLLDRGSVVYRNPLTATECSTPDPMNLMAANPQACPYFGEDVVDDEVATTAAAPLAFLPASQDPASATAAPVAPWRGTAAELITPEQLGLGRQRAQATSRGILDGLKVGFKKGMSNALLVSKDQTQSGHPIAVFGPQTGYYAPELLLELSQHGGDIHSRGMTFAGVPYVLIGRGVDFAWSATSSVDDIIDIRVLQLCDPAGGPATQNSLGYIYNGACKPIEERIDTWTQEYNAGSPPTGPGLGKKVTRRVLRAPDYGPVFGYATVQGAPVALVYQRSTYFGEVDSALPFVRTSRNQIDDPQSFYETFNTLTGTFNWFYVDADNIAYFNSGLLPVRASGVYPDLPTWGNGAYDWKQTGTGKLNSSWTLANFLPLEAHPRQTNPAKGYLTSWNNAQAPGFWAAEDMTAWGPVHRVLRLSKRLDQFKASGQKHVPTSMVEIMEEAGSTDLRGEDVLPSIFAVIDSGGPALTTAQSDAIAGLKAWVTDGVNGFGAHRRDRDGPGLDTTGLSYKHRDQVILMDRWWNTMVQHVLPSIHALETSPNGNVMISGRHDAPGPGGSAFFDGYYGYVRRMMDMARGISAHPYKRLKCAGSEAIADCRAALLTSLNEALVAIASDTTPDRPEEYDAIVHTAVGNATVPNIHWIDRPTWQQVVQPTAHRHP
jgi:acyl-homoserine lactone acylase PvdQ